MNSSLKEMWPKQKKIDITGPRSARVYDFDVIKNGEWYHDFKAEGIIVTDLLPLVGVGEVTHYMLAIQWQMQQKTERSVHSNY